MIYTGSAPATGLGHGDVELLRGLDAQDAANSSVEGFEESLNAVAIRPLLAC